MTTNRFTLWTQYDNLSLEEKIQICRNAIDFYADMPGPVAQRMTDRRRELLQQLLREKLTS